MNNKALKVFLEIGYIGVMGIFLILTSYHKLSSGHYIIMYFFNVCCIQLMEMFETRMSNFLIYKFVLFWFYFFLLTYFLLLSLHQSILWHYLLNTLSVLATIEKVTLSCNVSIIVCVNWAFLFIFLFIN